MEELCIIAPNKLISEPLKDMVESFSKYFSNITVIKSAKDCNFKNKKILFVMELGSTNFDLPMLNFFQEIYYKDENFFQDSIAAVLVHSFTELGTKDCTQHLIFLANNLGCTFIGHPVVEATGSLRNFLTWKKVLQKPLSDICSIMSSKLGKRLYEYSNPKKNSDKKLTVLYSSPHKVSNTLDLWHMCTRYLTDFKIKEIQVENGKVLDCNGCNYKLCLHYGKQNSCFYGGFMVENILPAIEEADSIVWLCPNYNDAVAANLTATINRLTVLYHKMSFHNKSMFGVIVSGNSGSDCVAKQLIGALNINKGFRLPSHGIITETANDPKSIFKVRDIDLKIKNFAQHIVDGV